MLLGKEETNDLGNVLTSRQSVMSEKDEVLDKRLCLLMSGRPDGFGGRAKFFRQ